MAEHFDPYYKWLGIPPDEQPANHYRLLGLRIYEADSDVIEHAADRLVAHLRTLQLGQHASLSQQILNEVTTARITLLDPPKRRNYDASLQQQDEVTDPLDMPLEPSVPVLSSHRLKPRRNAPRRVVGVTLAVFAMAIVVLIIVGVVRNNRKASDSGNEARVASNPLSQPDPPSREAGPDSAAKEGAAEPAETIKPAIPVEASLVFDFSDEAHLRKYWEWKYAWTFAADGGRAARGAQSVLKSRHRFAGDLTIDMDFRFGRAKFSNTGGCWITLWGKRLLITNGWRSLNAKIHIHREKNAIVYTYNGTARRIEVSPQVMAQPTPIEIRWRSRTSHFRRVEINAQRMTPLARQAKTTIGDLLEEG